MICLTDLVIKQVQSAALPKEWAGLETMKAMKYENNYIQRQRLQAALCGGIARRSNRNRCSKK